VRIVTTRYADLPAERRAVLEDIAEAEFMQYQLVRETQWADPDWSFQAFDGETFVGFHNIVLRSVRVDGEPVRIAGLNNVVTLAAHRGRGFAARMLRETQPRWVPEFGAESGMLLCADPLVAFYSKLGWVRVNARVVYDQPAGRKVWAANCMTLDARATPAEEVDLCGLPW
jgi:predicted N-acetyltransferase YhbS